ncbi:hypothetical protein SLEP1_g42697 [Rubroshorea leprosula]|uniref:Uncharacterized protein n=1 Tax=Rubroshorea leprosula TaxID=152421 RepID=A0AAV5LB84_9ROSI|nr:hypothetical protein SLEP1_g42697 [Rubroshorea leprosula]
MSEGMAKTIMIRFEPGRVLIYTELANKFAVFDWWFTSVPEPILCPLGHVV